MARFIYLKPVEEHSDEEFVNVFRCNSTLENEGTLYTVDCLPALDISDASSWIRRREDATMQCLKTTPNNSFFDGVSQNFEHVHPVSHLICSGARLRVCNQSTKYFRNL